MFTSRAFYQPRAIGSQIKSPIQLVVGTIRLLDLEMPKTLGLGGAMEQMGQVPLVPPNVKGWPGGRMWINTSTLFVRYNTAVFLASGTMAAGRRNVFSNANKRPEREPREVGGMKFVPPANGSPDEIVDAWVNRLIQRPIDDEKKRVLLDALGEHPRDEDVRKMVQLLV